MTMIRPEWKTHATTLLDFQYGLHHLIHIHIAFKKVGLIEIAFLIPFRATQMYETDPVPELTHHCRAVIVCTHAERTCAQAKSV